MVDTDDAVFERLAIRQFGGELGTGLHGGLGLGVNDRGRSILCDVGGCGLLLIERPVLRVFVHDGLHRLLIGLFLRAHEIATVGTGVDRVSDQVELVSDGSRHAGSGEHDH